MKPSIAKWTNPPEMEPGAPMPVALQKGTDLWVAYIVGLSESSAVLKFDGVEWAFLGSPNDEFIHEHPLNALGVEPYEFYEARGTSELTKHPGLRHWIITFHDETLEVLGKHAEVIAHRISGTNTKQVVREFGGIGSNELKYQERK